jgi:transketolase
MDLILIATGSEVGLITAAQGKLLQQGIAARTVSMPSWELFEAQPQEYKDSVLPPGIKARLAVEAGVCQGWCRYTGDSGDVIALNRFGASAPAKIVFEKLGYTVDNVIARALKLLNSK